MHKYNFTIEKFANWNDIEKWEYANCVAKCICRVQWLPLVKMMGFISVQFFRSSMCENGAKAAFRFRCVKYSTIMLLKFWNCDRYWSGYGEIGTCTQYPILQDIFERHPPSRFLHHISMTSQQLDLLTAYATLNPRNPMLKAFQTYQAARESVKLPSHTCSFFTVVLKVVLHGCMLRVILTNSWCGELVVCKIRAISRNN